MNIERVDGTTQRIEGLTARQAAVLTEDALSDAETLRVTIEQMERDAERDWREPGRWPNHEVRPGRGAKSRLRRLEERAAKTDERIAELERRLAEEPIRDKYGNKTMGTTEDPPDSEIYRNLLYYPDTVEIYVGPDGEAHRLC